MEKTYYIGQCPICCGYGRLEIDKDIINNEYMIICEECSAEWENPQDALKNVNGKRCFGKGEVRSATLDEIKDLGWDKFITDRRQLKMDKKVISITLWGNGAEKGKWIEWYDDIKEIMNSLGYKQTHIGITSKSYTSGKILTVARKEKEILAKIKDGEIPSSFSCYSLPKGYRQAVFDYEFYCEREEKDVSVIMNEVDYNSDNEQMIISVLKKYIDSEYGEIYSALRSDAPWVYAGTRKINDLKSYELIKRI